MKKLVESVKYLKVTDLFAPFIFLIILFPSLIFRVLNKIRKRNLWLICENGVTARDNGYYFYKYIRNNHKNDYCFYVIDKKSHDYDKVKDFDNIIQFKSLKHWLYYLAANLNISNHKNGNPNQPFFYFIHVSLGLYRNRVFLQHGITKDNSTWLYYKNTKFKYFICGAKREYEYIKKYFGYPEKNVIYTGFPRFDGLYDNKINMNQILIMPTWRNWLGRETNNLGDKINFIETNYYKNWNSLLNNNEFIKYIEAENLNVLFYPHIEMEKYLDNFKANSKKIKIITSKVDIQTTLKESEILITDYSSVYMDFAYMEKPVIYFQFDYEEYRDKQYQDGYFDYKKDGFGPIAHNPEELIECFKVVHQNKLEDKYFKRMKSFFELKDKNNCNRIYNILKGDENNEKN